MVWVVREGDVCFVQRGGTSEILQEGVRGGDEGDEGGGGDRGVGVVWTVWTVCGVVGRV